MDHRTHEPERQALHGMVTPPQPTHPARNPGPAAKASAWPVVVLALGMAALLGGIAGGLLRAGVPLPQAMAPTGWAGHAAVAHGALMVCGFMGTVIGIERAVAVKRLFAWLAPAASGAGGLCLMAAQTSVAAGLLSIAAAVFVGVNLVVVQRQRAAHTALLLAGALAWLVGCLLFWHQPGNTACLPWWFAFLVMTIAAERLEMTRLMRRRPGAQLALGVLLTALVAGASVTIFSARTGGVLYGLSLLLLALWLGVFDIARRTVAAPGLPRYMAVCLLGGYAWLALAGIAWVATALGWPLRDAALHALGLGFIVSMIMGHAPVILPAIARIKLPFSRLFYLPLLALHLSLVVRLFAGLHDLTWRGNGALLNAVAIGLFAATMAGTALRWKLHALPKSPPPKQG